MLSLPHPTPLADITNQLDTLSTSGSRSTGRNHYWLNRVVTRGYNYLVSKFWYNSFIYREKETENQVMKRIAQATKQFGFWDSCFFSCLCGVN